MAKSLNFEEALARLEEIVHNLEAGDLSLNDALAAFEEGISMVKLCGRQLQQAERKAQRLSKSALEIMEPENLEST